MTPRLILVVGACLVIRRSKTNFVFTVASASCMITGSLHFFVHLKIEHETVAEEALLPPLLTLWVLLHLVLRHKTVFLKALELT